MQRRRLKKNREVSPFFEDIFKLLDKQTELIKSRTMKPEPLKDKVFYFDNLVFGMGKPEGKFILPKVDLEDITSAVEWLKEQLCHEFEADLDKCRDTKTFKLIDKAFQDVIKK